jgi:hypothetical protein
LTFNVESMPTRAERCDSFRTPSSGSCNPPFKKSRGFQVSQKCGSKKKVRL